MKIPRASIWPTVTFNTTRPDEMAKAEAWVRSLSDERPSARRITVGGAAWPVTASEPPNSTRTAQETNRTPQSDVVNTLLEAASAAAQARTLPPPKPGTHESDLCDQGVLCCRMCAADRNYQPPMVAAEYNQFTRAHTWSARNRKENA